MKFLKEYSTEEIVNFITKLNSQYESRIEFLDDSQDAIKKDVENIIDNSKGETIIFVAEDNDILQGVFILDTDIEDNSADVWGPFIAENNTGLAIDLWKYALSNTKSEVKIFEFAINYKNIFALEFLKQINAELYDENKVLVHKKENYTVKKTDDVVEAPPEIYDDIKKLHSKVFPHYFLNFNSQKDSDEKQKLYIIKDNNSQLKGYIHIIYDPVVNDALINYLAIDDRYRRKGFAKQLIQKALNVFYNYHSISECYLRIDTENSSAEKLYLSLDFNITFETKVYRYHHS